MIGCRLLRGFCVLGLAAGGVQPLAAQDPPSSAPPEDPAPIYLVGASVLDGMDPEPIRNATVVVEGGTITAVEEGELEPPEGATVLRLDGYYIVPGLIDAHAHVSTLDGLERALQSGVTTMRTAGVRNYRDLTIRDMVREGHLPGPDVLAAGLYVQPDLGDRVLEDPRLGPLHVTGVNTPEELRYLVRLNVERGVDWIKTRGTARMGLGDGWQDPREQVYTEAQLRVIVEEAGRAGVPVMAHAHGEEGLLAAVRAGVRSVEHGTYASDEALREMRERGTFLVPTLIVMVGTGERQQHMGPRVVDTVQRAYRMGIPIVAGADTYYQEGSRPRVSGEILRLMEAGLSPWDALRAATSLAAELLEIDDRTGSIRPGLEADLLIVERNPLEDMRTLQDIFLIMSNGRVVFDRLPFGLEAPVGGEG